MRRGLLSRRAVAPTAVALSDSTSPPAFFHLLLSPIKFLAETLAEFMC